METVREQILRLKDVDKVPMIVVGNKSDLRGWWCISSILDYQGQRQIYVHEGEAFAKRLGCPFVGSSAKTDTNVDYIFEQITREIRATLAAVRVHK